MAFVSSGSAGQEVAAQEAAAVRQTSIGGRFIGMSGSSDRSSSMETRRLLILDGWRAISILLVMAAHMLPLGPKPWQLNVSSGSLGMVIFFSLSGFLITATLAGNPSVSAFFVRRFFRILPLAFLYIVAVGLLTMQSGLYWPVYLTFIENYATDNMTGLGAVTPFTAHFWSLCVEIHFYLLIGLWAAFAGFRRVMIIPAVLLAVTITKFLAGDYGTPVTHRRIDEILGGATLALIYLDLLPAQIGAGCRTILRHTPFPLAFCALALCCHPVVVAYGGECLRPYVAILTIGSSIYQADRPYFAPMHSRVARYIATISFALYVLHPVTMMGWLGEGDSKVIIYLKRPICILLSFAIAHVSTFAFEMRMIAIGKRISGPGGVRRTPVLRPR